jgi:hypothetical protein
MATTKGRGKFGATPKLNACFSRSNKLIAQLLSGMARSINSQIASSAEDSGALAAIFSNTRRSPAAIASARLRSVMSMMLARSNRRLELGRRTNLTSQGKFWPVESQCTHSNTGTAPAKALST